MPLTSAEIAEAVAEAERTVNEALPLGRVDPGPRRQERERFRAVAYAEVLRELLAAARQPSIVPAGA